jgi:hypothetical protein
MWTSLYRMLFVPKMSRQYDIQVFFLCHIWDNVVLSREVTQASGMRERRENYMNNENYTLISAAEYEKVTV